ncbi:signal recognition particle, SRP19 subunit [Lentinula raphanica]|uniref:Signal recognition particle, SRP19 subunit n=1 Tax=Lentinula raphanica TaxID=153919 RepID=A0AA38PEM0_9AGAR|nr:signal recognition particle, SRP19 subunit [Lentinula raphanica]KAJ3841146.1 signal recognition particle, SRP19 subunit [Lentinula raphanica]KAJ3974938.1 signal recognition particle, SRP19 subunit [Lentinula raphanica]
MSRKTVVVEDEFDDDTDLPLPARPLPNTGVKGPLLQEIASDSDSDDDLELNTSQRAGPASPPSSHSQFRPEGASQLPKNTVTDITPYKSWTCIYPIYIDAKRPYGTGQRRVERAKSIWWPLSKDIAEATNRLGLGTLHEVNKAHPRDWENPGRVRVQWKKEGRLMNPAIKTKKQLLEMISLQIQHLKPENIPRPPYSTSPLAAGNTSGPTSTANTAPSSNKGKAPVTTKSKAPIAPQPKPSSKQMGGRRLPVPPEPLPPLAARLSPYSPALPTGVLIDTVKAGMNATENNAGALGGPGASGPFGSAGGPQKGKRKVVRVRG